MMDLGFDRIPCRICGIPEEDHDYEHEYEEADPDDLID